MTGGAVHLRDDPISFVFTPFVGMDLQQAMTSVHRVTLIRVVPSFFSQGHVLGGVERSSYYCNEASQKNHAPPLSWHASQSKKNRRLLDG